MNKIKRVYAILFSALLLASLMLFSTPVHAKTVVLPTNNDEFLAIQPFWTNIATITLNPVFTNGKGVLTGSVIGNSGTSSITVNATLARVNANGTTTHITSWNNLKANGNIFAWEGVYYVVRGYDYKFTFQVTAVRNGVSETVTVSQTARAN